MLMLLLLLLPYSSCCQPSCTSIAQRSIRIPSATRFCGLCCISPFRWSGGLLLLLLLLPPFLLPV